MSRVVVTGLGVIAAVGRGVEATRRALVFGASGLGRLRGFTSPRCGHFPVGEVKDVDLASPRSLTLARIALEEAIGSAGLDFGGLDEERTALCLGSIVGGMPETEDALARELEGGSRDDAVLLRHECGYVASQLADSCGARGPIVTVSDACASGAQAIAIGADLLAMDQADLVLAGGTDALCRLTLNGFASLLAMDPEGCRPFDRRRKGMSLGEGAAFLVLEREASALQRGAVPLAVLAGSANTCDAYHATGPDPEGRGAESAMRLALARAGRQPRDVDYINAHGTGTPDNDRAEGGAVARLFAGRVPPISSTKGLFGHTLAAAGAIEAVVSILALRDGLLPATTRCEEPDKECAIDPLMLPVRTSPRLILSNSFGFGGNNSVLCFEAMGARP